MEFLQKLFPYSVVSISSLTAWTWYGAYISIYTPLGVVVSLVFLTAFLTLFVRKLTHKDANIESENQNNWSRNTWLGILFISAIGLFIAGHCDKPQALDNVSLNSWTGQWFVKQIKENETPEKAEGKVIEWKIVADAENPESGKKELIATFGEGKWKLSSLEKHEIESNKNACLQGRFTNIAGEKFRFEFYMSPDKKSYMGKMWPEGSKTKQPLTIWHCTRD